jgi:hypothetical protein
MDKVTFKKIQQNFTAVALVSGSVATVFAIDGYYLLMENDLSEFGFTVLPWIIGLGYAVCGLALVARFLVQASK